MILFFDVLLAFMCTEPLLKIGLLRKERIYSHGEQSFFLNLEFSHFQKVGKKKKL